MGISLKFYSVVSRRSKNELYSSGDSKFFDPFIESIENKVKNLDYNFLLWRRETNDLINILYADKLLIYYLSASSESLEDLLGCFGTLIKDFSYKMEDDNFRFSDTVRTAYLDPKVLKILLNRKKNALFYLVGLLALQAQSIPEVVYLEYPIKRADGQDYEVPIILDWGKFQPSGIADKTALSITGPDFQKDIEYVVFNPGRITVREILTFINNCKYTGRRRKEEDNPSYWPKAAIFIAKEFPVPDLKKHFEDEKVRKHDLHHYLTPEAAPKLLPGRSAPPSQRCNLKFFEYKENESLFERIII
jgi:hypothetical protein